MKGENVIKITIAERLGSLLDLTLVEIMQVIKNVIRTFISVTEREAPIFKVSGLRFSP
jgi:hypothetical protein